MGGINLPTPISGLELLGLNFPSREGTCTYLSNTLLLRGTGDLWPQNTRFNFFLSRKGLLPTPIYDLDGLGLNLPFREGTFI